MSEPRAISGTYSDLKFIKTRSVAQIVMEIPIEEADAFLKMFGAPQPGREVPVAIARLNDGAVAQRIEHSVPNREAEGSNPSGSAKPKRQWSELSLPEQCGIRCAEPEFQRFLSESHPTYWYGQDGEMHQMTRAAQTIRSLFCIKSRTELAINENAAAQWRQLESEYQAWLTDQRYADARR